MALTNIVFSSGSSSVAARGDTGTLSNITASRMCSRRFLVVPLAAQVESGVTYGQQGTELTGSFVGGGGGSGVSRARVVNA